MANRRIHSNLPGDLLASAAADLLSAVGGVGFCQKCDRAEIPGMVACRVCGEGLVDPRAALVARRLKRESEAA